MRNRAALLIGVALLVVGCVCSEPEDHHPVSIAGEPGTIWFIDSSGVVSIVDSSGNASVVTTLGS